MVVKTKSAQSADDVMRASIAKMPVPPFDPPAFNAPTCIKQSRVAIVTTAGLMRPGEDAWTHDDADFRVFNHRETDLFAGHVSMSLDRVGMYVDRNVFYPLDRLHDLADFGEIGSVAPRHISFMGALRTSNELSTLMLDSGPRAAKLLKDDGVDIVFLTPICPACSRTVLVLGHVLESHGLSTVVLASNFELAKRAQPPRALFCDFPLGRPVGPPKQPDFQLRVLRTALSLLEKPSGPVLAVFPETIKDEADTPVVCTLPPKYDPTNHPAVDEAKGLLPAWERAIAANGHTHMGRQITAEEVPESIEKLMAVIDGKPWLDIFTLEDVMLQTIADIRVYYEEAATALVDHVPAARSAEAWFYQRTETGKLLKDLTVHLRNSGQESDMSMMALAYIVPPSQTEIEYSPRYSKTFSSLTE